MYTLFSERGEFDWFGNGSDALSGCGGPTSPTLAMVLYAIGAWEQSDRNCLTSLSTMYHHGYYKNPADRVRAAELYSRIIAEDPKCAAKNKLANLLNTGSAGVDSDAAQAVELYGHVIEERNDVEAMNSLALLLHTGAKGVDADPVRAADLYMCAIEEGSNVNAMNNLACFLKDCAEDLEADPAQALDLYSRAIDEGRMLRLWQILPVFSGKVPTVWMRILPGPTTCTVGQIDEGANTRAMMEVADMLRQGSVFVAADP